MKAVRELTAKWLKTYAKLIEDKANGSAAIQMRTGDPGPLPVIRRAARSARAQAISPLWKPQRVSPAPGIRAVGEHFIESAFNSRMALATISGRDAGDSPSDEPRNDVHAVHGRPRSNQAY